MNKTQFSFENLDVWQKAIEFANMTISITEQLQTERRHFRLIEQLEAASTSIALNIAEGKGRYSKKEFMQFLYIARGSLFETITLLTIFYKRGWIDVSLLEQIRNFADEIGKMLSGLINSLRKP
jgi:four helix bundle protein